MKVGNPCSPWWYWNSPTDFYHPLSLNSLITCVLNCHDTAVCLVCTMFGCVISRKSISICSFHERSLCSPKHERTPTCFPQPFCASTSSVTFFYLFIFFIQPRPSLKLQPILVVTTWKSVGCLSSWKQCPGSNMRLGLATLLCSLSFVRLADCAPPTCYSRALGLSKEIMVLLDKIHTYHRTVSILMLATLSLSAVRAHSVTLGVLTTLFVGLQIACAEVLPTIFLDVHVSKL